MYKFLHEVSRDAQQNANSISLVAENSLGQKLLKSLFHDNDAVEFKQLESVKFHFWNKSAEGRDLDVPNQALINWIEENLDLKLPNAAHQILELLRLLSRIGLKLNAAYQLLYQELDKSWLSPQIRMTDMCSLLQVLELHPSIGNSLPSKIALWLDSQKERLPFEFVATLGFVFSQHMMNHKYPSVIKLLHETCSEILAQPTGSVQVYHLSKFTYALSCLDRNYAWTKFLVLKLGLELVESYRTLAELSHDSDESSDDEDSDLGLGAKHKSVNQFWYASYLHYEMAIDEMDWNDPARGQNPTERDLGIEVQNQINQFEQFFAQHLVSYKIRDPLVKLIDNTGQNHFDTSKLTTPDNLALEDIKLLDSSLRRALVDKKITRIDTLVALLGELARRRFKYLPKQTISHLLARLRAHTSQWGFNLDTYELMSLLKNLKNLNVYNEILIDEIVMGMGQELQNLPCRFLIEYLVTLAHFPIKLNEQSQFTIRSSIGALRGDDFSNMNFEFATSLHFSYVSLVPHDKISVKLEKDVIQNLYLKNINIIRNRQSDLYFGLGGRKQLDGFHRACHTYAKNILLFAAQRHKKSASLQYKESLKQEVLGNQASLRELTETTGYRCETKETKVHQRVSESCSRVLNSVNSNSSGNRVTIENEYRVFPYSVDIVVQTGKYKLAIELNGQPHYFLDGQESANDQYKYEILRYLDFELLVIKNEVVQALPNDQALDHYIRESFKSFTPLSELIPSEQTSFEPRSHLNRPRRYT